MTRSLLVAACSIALSACVSTSPARPEAPAAGPVVATASISAPAAGPRTFGAFSAGEALSADEAAAQSASLNGQVVRIAGTIREVCQGTGCWMAFSTNQGQTIRMITHEVGGRDTPALLFPHDAAGRNAEVVGTLRVEDKSVDDRRRIAEAAGASAEDVASIAEPVGSVSLMISAVRID